MATDTRPTPIADATPKKKSRLPLILIAAVVVLALGGGGYVFLHRSAPDPATQPGAVVALDSMTISLDGGQFLKVSVALQESKAAGKAFDTSTAQDLIISTFTGIPAKTLESAQERAKLKSELLRRIQAAYPHQILDLRYTEFVWQ